MKLLYRSLLVFTCVLLLNCSSDKNQISDKPNIIFFFADDQTYTSINALGNDEIETPNLDKLINSGTAFTNAYNMGSWSGAVCVASRAMIISGRSVWRAQEMTDAWKKGQNMDQTWGKIMEGGGYNTYMTGKWHVDAPADSVFQNVVNVRPGMPNDAWDHFYMESLFDTAVNYTTVKPEDIMPVGYNRPLGPEDSSWSPTDKKFGGFWEGGTHWSEVLRNDAVSFINKAGQAESPFFMYLAFNSSHDPRQSPQEYLDKYPIENISLEKSWAPNYPYKDQIGNGPRLRDEALAPFPRTEYAIKVHKQEYYAIITHMDEQIGQILKALEESGKMDNTYIFFTADHGLAMGRHGLLGKQNMYQHSMKVPLVIAGPGIPQGKKVEQSVYLQDLMATSLELGGIEKPDYVDFNSLLLHAKEEKARPSYDAVYGCYKDLQRMIIKDNFKLIVYPKIPKLRLYDLANDPEEIVDLAESQEHKKKANELFNELVKLQVQMKDSLNLRAVVNL